MTNNSYHQPIRLSDNLSIYSGDIITFNNNQNLLVELVGNENIKLRKLNSNEYLYKSKNLLKPLNFSDKFGKASIFVIKSNGFEVSLKTSDKYLDFDSKKPSLSSKEEWLTINKRENNDKIADYQEIIESIEFHKDRVKIIIDEKTVIYQKSYDNKTDETLEYNCELSKEISKEKNLTWSKEFTLGAETKLSCSLLAGLDISGKLERKHSSSNSITKTEVETITDSIKVNCLPWKETKVKLEVRKIRSIIPCTKQIKRIISGRTYEYLIGGELSSDNYSESRCLTEMDTVRNILLVGWTGSGKSTLANVLSDSSIFAESNQTTSETRFFQKSEEFEWDGNHYCVIDNIGFGDNREIDEKETLERIGEAIKSARQGLSHVLLVFDGKFSEKVKEDFEKLVALKITNSLISIVRTRFENFRTAGECKKDEESLKALSDNVRTVLNKCRKLIHINNDDSNSRKKSREKVLNHLHNNCPDSFKPKEWDDINNLINNYLETKAALLEDIQVDVGRTEVINQQINSLETSTVERVREKIKGEEISELIEVIGLGSRIN